MEEAICVPFDCSGTRKLGVGEGGEGGSLVMGNEGLKKASVVVGKATVEVAKKVPLSMVIWKMKKENEIEDSTTIEDDDGWVGKRGKHEGKDDSMGFTMIDISGGSTDGGGKNMGHEVVRPCRSCWPGGDVGVNGEQGCGSNGGAGVRVMSTIGG